MEIFSGYRKGEKANVQKGRNQDSSGITATGTRKSTHRILSLCSTSASLFRLALFSLLKIKFFTL